MGSRRLPLCRPPRGKWGSRKLKCPMLGGFDIETKGLGGEFIIGAIWTCDTPGLLFHSLDDLFGYMVDHPQYRWLAHNASGYEFAYLYPILYDFFASHRATRIVPTIQGDTRIIQLLVEFEDEGEPGKPGKPTKVVLDMRDTLPLFNMGLESVAKAFCPELPKLKVIDFDKEDFDPENPKHIEYVIRDAQICVMAYQKHWQNMVDVYGSPLGVTAGSTAMMAFRMCIPEGHVYYRINEEADQFIRQAYYGGLVLPGHEITDWGNVMGVDINGAYAYQMRDNYFPVGNPTGTHKYLPGYLGFYKVRATVPKRVFEEIGFNPLPLRTKDGLCWPNGTFETVISNIEIEYAREKGCTIDVIGGYIFTRKEQVFHDFITKCQSIELADGGIYKPSIKQNRNSLYGKFGSKPTHHSLVFSLDDPIHDPRDLYPLETEKGQRIRGLWTCEEVTDSPYMLPHWAALVTAYERIYIMKFVEQAYRLGAKNVYCDTDSIKADLSVISRMIEEKIIPIGDSYGEFKAEEICSEFYVLGPKAYYGSGEDGEVKKAKGIPKRKTERKLYKEAIEALNRPISKTQRYKENEAFREVEFISVLPLMTIIKENSKVRPVKRKRKITDIRNSYAWEFRDNKIFPITMTLEKQYELVNQEGVPFIKGNRMIYVSKETHNV